MCYRHYFLLDMRSVKTAEDVACIAAICHVVFLLYAVDLPDDVLSALKQKCRHVVCFLPLSSETELSAVWNSLRHM